MKLANSILLIVIILIILSQAVNVFAESTNIPDYVTAISSIPIGKPSIDITSVIEEKVNQTIVQERYNMGSLEKPQIFTYDTTIYLLEYNVSTEYWSNVSEMNYEGITAPIYYDYPTIYIPLFAEIADTTGVLMNRVIGHIKLSYDWGTSDYNLGLCLYNLASENYKDRKILGFYEEIADYLNRNEIVSSEVFMIRYPSSLSEDHEKIAVIQTNDNTIILDVSNSLYVTKDEQNTDRALAYSISDYSALRREVEKELYKDADGWGKNFAGGKTQSAQNPKTFSDYWLLFCLIILLVGIISSCLIIKKLHKRASK